MRYNKFIVTALTVFALTGCSRAAESPVEYAPRDTSVPTVDQEAITYVEPTVEVFNTQMQGFNRVVSQLQGETEVSKYITSRHLQDLLTETETWEWTEAVKTLQAQRDHWSVAEVVSDTRTEVNAVGADSASSVRALVYSLTYNLEDPPREVTCSVTEVWKLEAGTWKLDLEDKSDCIAVTQSSL